MIDLRGTVRFGIIGVLFELIATAKYRGGIVISNLAETTETGDPAQKQVAEVLNLVQVNYALAGFEEAVRGCLGRKADRFKTKFTPVSRTSTVQHRITLEEKDQHHTDLLGDSIHSLKTVKRTSDELLEDAINVDSSSPWGAGVVLAHKQAGTQRFVIANRRLHDVTVADPYPITRVADTWASMNGANSF